MRLFKYLLQYRFKEMGDLIKNEKKSPKQCDEDLHGKTVVITGATSGIGYETAKLFAEKGAKLICINRSIEKSKQLEDFIKNNYKTQIESFIYDFSSLEQINKCAEELITYPGYIDIIIHNAGVFNTKREFTKDGIERVFQVNHLAAFIINSKLKKRLKKENRARIIYVNSEGHRFALAGVHTKDLAWERHLYTGLKSYGSAKTAQLLTMLKFKDYFKDTKVTINAMHPGNVTSNMGNNNGKLYRFIKQKLILSKAKNPEISAKALLYLAVSKDVERISGKFFNLTTIEKPAPHGRDIKQIQPVWQKSMELAGLDE